MSKTDFFRIRVYFTVLITLAIWSLLTWNYFHGGVPSHYILANKDLPEISNMLGAILLPLLTWLLTYRVQKRIFLESNWQAELSLIRHAIYSFAFSLTFGIVVAGFFYYGYPDMTGNLMVGIFVLALFLPVYRGECLLGFVIGMTVTFGAVLPIGIGSILASIAFVMYRGVRPAAMYVGSLLKKKL